MLFRSVTPVVPDVPKDPEVPEVPEVSEVPEDSKVSVQEEISTTYLLEQLEAVRKDSAHIQAAMDKISLMGAGEETKICALREIAVSREATNQQLVQTYSTLLARKNPPKMPSFDNWGKKWNELKDKAKTTVEMNFTPEQDAEIKRQIDEAAQDLQDAARDLKDIAKRGAKRGGESVQHYVNEALNAIRQATNGKVDIHIRDQGASVVDRGTGVRKNSFSGSALDMVTEILRDPSLSMEEKELIFDHIEEIRDVDEATQAKVLEILGDVTLSVEEKELILDHLEGLQELS